MSRQKTYFLSALGILSVIVVAILLRVLVSANQPLHYMVAGTCLTAVALAGAFVVIVKRRWL